MDTRFKPVLTKLPLLTASAALSGLLLFPGISLTSQMQRMTEDFSSLDHADPASSTGVWNIASHGAHAAVFANADPARPLDFGDGSDGALSSSSGYAFDTDAHPNGFNFRSVDITAGTVTVTGSRPLVIRSLSSVRIVPPIPVKGGDGSNGSLNASTSAAAGGLAVASIAHGGNGGAANASAASSGGDGFQATGATEDFTAGPGTTGAGAGSDAANSATGPGSPASFDTSGSFIAGTGGAGGGGHSDAGSYATGGAGGAGGGTVRILALGDITLSSIDASGGSGGKGASGGALCAGNGAGGNGGGIWLQAYGTLSPGSLSVSGGAGATNGCNLGDVTGVTGSSRGDAISGSFNGFSTRNAPASGTYVVQSKGYDLGTLNASFPIEPVPTTTTNGGSISLAYAGSADGVTYSGFTDQIASLGNQGYRWVRFRATITTASNAGPSPVLSKLVINYTDLGIDRLDLKLSAGCGTLAGIRRSGSGPASGSGSSPTSLLLLSVLSFAGLSLLLHGFSLTLRREDV